MRAALRVRTTVLPGQRIELAVPQPREGETVEVVIFPRPAGPAAPPSLLEFLEALPSGPRSYPNWEEIDRRFQGSVLRGTVDAPAVRLGVCRLPEQI